MTRLEEIRAEIARLEAEGKELEKKDGWIVDGHGKVCPKCKIYLPDNFALQGRVFDTLAEAEWFSKFERAQAKLRSLNKGCRASTNKSEGMMWYPKFDRLRSEWVAHQDVYYDPFGVPFFTHHDLYDAIAAMGDQMDDLKPFKGV